MEFILKGNIDNEDIRHQALFTLNKYYDEDYKEFKEPNSFGINKSSIIYTQGNASFLCYRTKGNKYVVNVLVEQK